jgi:tetratricopeptide (TPR) repeat protein
MAKRRAQRRDPMDSVIESALQPGRFIGWNEGFSFVSGLQHLESEIKNIVASDPARAVALYETFIAGCNLKAEEIDDSDGEHGTFAGGLFCGWIAARQTAGADPGQTAEFLLAWMDDDDYGFCNDLERSAVKVLDRAGLEAFEREVQVRFEAAYAAARKREDRALNYDRDRWGQMLRAIYSEQRSLQKYLDLTGRTGLTQADREAIATMFQAKRKLNDALAWLEQGIQMDKPDGFQLGATDKLAGMRRDLLAKLGRGSEALDSAWAEFQMHPDTSTYEDLMCYVPKTERGAWHEKAMAASEQGDRSVGRSVGPRQRYAVGEFEPLRDRACGAASWEDASRRGGEGLPRIVRAHHRRRQEQILL